MPEECPYAVQVEEKKLALGCSYLKVQVASSNDEGRQVHARELAGTLLWPVAIEGNSSVERMKESVSSSKKNCWAT